MIKGLRIRGEMSAFKQVPLGKGQWMSTGSTIIESERIGTFIIPPYEINDLASIPVIFHRMFPPNAPHRVAAYIHDYLYEYNGKIPEFDVSRKDADLIFRDAMAMPKVDFWQTYNQREKDRLNELGLMEQFYTSAPLVGDATAATMYNAVRLGGWRYWED